MAIPRVELMTSSVASLRTKTGLQAIDSAVLTREPLPWSGRGQNRRLQLVGKVGGPGRDRTDDLFHAMEARSQLRHRPTACDHSILSKREKIVKPDSRPPSLKARRKNTLLHLRKWNFLPGFSSFKVGKPIDLRSSLQADPMETANVPEPFGVPSKAPAGRRGVSLKEPMVIALETLRAHKLRSFLTLLGVILSVSTLIVVVSLIEGTNRYISDHVANFGANVFLVRRFPIVTSREQFAKLERRNKNVTWEDFEYLRDNIRLAE